MSARRRLWSQDQAQAGPATMLVFVANVLVAGVAAGILISSQSDVQARSDDAQDGSGSALEVQSVLGRRADLLQGLDGLSVYLSAEGSSTDMERLRIRFSEPMPGVLSYGPAPSPSHFGMEVLRDRDGSLDQDRATLDADDVVRIDIDLGSALGGTVGEQTTLRFVIVPEQGPPIPVRVSTPMAFGTGLVVPLA